MNLEMSSKRRRFIFYGLVFVFIVASLVMISYSQGWRINIENCRIKEARTCSIAFQKIGAVFIDAKPKGILIKIDGKVFQDKSGLVQNGTLIDNLLPGKYEIEIEKENYLPWRKNVSVESGLVTEVSEIILIPEKIEKTSVPLPKTIDAFWMKGRGKIVFKTGGMLYYLPALIPSGRGSPNEIGRQDSSGIKLRGDEFVGWSEDGDKMTVRDSKNGVYYLHETNNFLKALNVSALSNSLGKISISKLAFHPIESNRLIIESKKGNLYLIDSNRIKLEKIFEQTPGNGPVLAWTVKNPTIYFINDNFLTTFNLVAKVQSFTAELPGTGEKPAISEMSASGNKIAFLTENGSLYLFNRETQNFNQITHSAQNFTFSFDNKKIAFLDNDGKINVYFPDDYKKEIRKKAGETAEIKFFAENSLEIKSIHWHKDSSHLLVEYEKKDAIRALDFVEIDDRLPINKYTLVDNASNFHYEPDSNHLYFIQENNLHFIEI